MWCKRYNWVEKRIKALENDVESERTKGARWQYLYELWRDRYQQIVAMERLHGERMFEAAVAQQYAFASANCVRTQYDYDGVEIVRVHFPEFTAVCRLGDSRGG